MVDFEMQTFLMLILAKQLTKEIFLPSVGYGSY